MIVMLFFLVFTVLKGNPPSMHSRPAFNDDPIDTKEDNDGK